MKKFFARFEKYKKPLILILSYLRAFNVLFAKRKNIKDLNKNLEKRNSFKQVFLRGLVSGFARAIGATIIAAIVITVLVKFLSAVDISFIDNILEKANIRYINPQ